MTTATARKAPATIELAAAEYGLWVNAEGKRFVNELANRKVRADANATTYAAKDGSNLVL